MKIFYDTEAQPHDWIKGAPKQYVFTFPLEGVTAGRYVLATGIVDDASADKKIGIFISAKGSYTADGWLKVGDITVE